MKRRLLRRIVILSSVVVVGIAVTLVAVRHDVARTLERVTLPPAVTYEQVATTPSPVTSSAVVSPATSPLPATNAPPTASLPAEINLAVPFTAQAPHAIWEPPYKEFCEEASVLMTISYVRGDDIPSATAADQAMLAIKGFEEARFGYYEDTTAAETAIILKEFYKYDKVALAENPTADDIKQALAGGKLVIMPAAGQLLHNPYFRAPGPPYHMVVIKGYTAAGQFIVNDPGTRRGADYVYEADVLMNAMHDWRTDGQIERGRKVIIIVG